MARRELTPEEIFSGVTEAPEFDVKKRQYDANGNPEPTPEEFFAAEASKATKGKKGRAATAPEVAPEAPEAAPEATEPETAPDATPDEQTAQ